MRAHVVALMVTLAAVAPAVAQEASAPSASTSSEAPHVLQRKWPKPETCNREIATAVDFAALLKNLPAWHNRCVSVSGYFHGRALYVNADDTALKLPMGEARSAIPRAGVYGSDATFDALGKLQDAEYITAVGMVWDCQDLQGSDAVMILGYCHTDRGPILGLASFKIAREPLKNQED